MVTQITSKWPICWSFVGHHNHTQHVSDEIPSIWCVYIKIPFSPKYVPEECCHKTLHLSHSSALERWTNPDKEDCFTLFFIFLSNTFPCHLDLKPLPLSPNFHPKDSQPTTHPWWRWNLPSNIFFFGLRFSASTRFSKMVLPLSLSLLLLLLWISDQEWIQREILRWCFHGQGNTNQSQLLPDRLCQYLPQPFHLLRTAAGPVRVFFCPIQFLAVRLNRR